MPNSDGSNERPTLGAFGYFAAIVLCCFIVGGLTYHLGREKERRYKTTASYAQAAEADAQSACVGLEGSTSFECVYKKVEAAQEQARGEQDLSAQQKAANSALLSAIVAFFTLILSGVGVWYVRGTLRATLAAVEDTGKATEAMHEANEIARDTAKRQLRAYVTPDLPTINHHPSGNFNIECSMIATNNGATPAKTVAWVGRLVCVLDEEMEDEFSQLFPKIFVSKGVIGAGKTLCMKQDIPVRLPEYRLKRLEDGTAKIMMYGVISYIDIFGDEWVTKYRLFYHYTLGFVWDEIGNEAT